jgi:hypothetical protein
MVFRTHRHLVARATGQQGHAPDSLVAASRPLGSYREEYEAAMLRGVMVKDALRAAPVSEGPRIVDAHGESDLVDVFVRRAR